MQYVKLFQRYPENSSLHKFARLQIWLQRSTLPMTFMQCILASKFMFAKYARFANLLQRPTLINFANSFTRLTKMMDGEYFFIGKLRQRQICCVTCTCFTQVNSKKELIYVDQIEMALTKF